MSGLKRREYGYARRGMTYSPWHVVELDADDVPRMTGCVRSALCGASVPDVQHTTDRLEALVPGICQECDARYSLVLSHEAAGRVLLEAVYEAVRVLNGGTPPEEQDAPAARFYNLLNQRGLDYEDLPPRVTMPGVD
jgi:hypothetical protein